MPGNEPNVSRDSFDTTKFYDKVSIQDGVPVVDSDWNEMLDVLRMSILLHIDSLMGGGYRVGTTSFQPKNATSTTNNFAIDDGWALVDGVIIPSTNDDPPQEFDYDSEDNYLVAGTVTAINGGAGTIEDTEQFFQSFHDLIATGNHGACRVKMLTGTEAGNFFSITAFTSTTLTLSGGIGTIGVGDTFKVVLPSLTTPVAPRIDSVYIMAWWEDIASEEDSNIVNPGLGVEASHRSQRRWCVRVNENTSSVPSTSVIQSFTARYLKIAEMQRTASATIDFSSTVTLTDSNIGDSFYSFYNSAFGGTGTSIGVNTDYTNGPLTDINGGGLGDLDPGTLSDALAKINTTLVNRRAYTGVVTDGTSSTGGDYNGANGIDDIDGLTGGKFLIRRGTHTFSSVTSLGTTKEFHLDGEGAILSKIHAPSGLSSDFIITGSINDVYLESEDTTYSFGSSDDDVGLSLRNVQFESGALRISGGKIDWRGGYNTGNTASKDHASTLEINDDISNPYGIIDNVYFGNPNTGGTPIASVYLNAISSGVLIDRSGRGLVFRNCKFFSSETGVDALRINSCDISIKFQNCTFESDVGAGWCVQLIDSDNVSFEDCSFNHEDGKLLRIGSGSGGNKFKNCSFTAKDGTTVADHQFIVVHSALSRGTYFTNCSLKIEDSIEDQPTGEPLVEFGGENGTRVSGNQAIVIDGFHIDLLDAGNIQADTLFLFWGSSDENEPSRYSNITLFMNGKSRSIAASSGKANLGTSDAALMEFIGDADVKVHVENVKIIDIGGSSSSIDQGSVINIEDCIMKGLFIDGNSINNVGIYDSVIAIYDNSELYDVIIGESDYIPSDYLIDIGNGNNSKVIGGRIENVDNNNVSSLPYIAVSGENEISNIRWTAEPRITRNIITTSASQYFIRITGWFVKHTVSGTVQFVKSPATSKTISVVNNTVYCNLSGATDVIDLDGQSSLVDGNILASSSATAPTIDNVGVGSTTGDNVLAASV